ncbi:MAG: HD domain-containing protein [Bdellovibrionaceae bacterium]|nr:HD domain-containing protein [Pseudobdellovibrionaceae bacterium]
MLASGDIPEWAFSAVESILTSLKVADPETYAHCLRVGEHARKLAKFAGLTEYQQRVAQFSGLMHDVGKMGVDLAITHKPGKLTDSEYDIMKSHPILSEEIIQPMAHHEFFQQILPAVRGHHERVDGKGYPDKLHGEDVPLIARVILIVDTLDAMGQTRAYRKGLPVDVIYKELERFAGTQFDQALVKIFLEVHQRHWDKEAADVETIRRVTTKAA